MALYDNKNLKNQFLQGIYHNQQGLPNQVGQEYPNLFSMTDAESFMQHPLFQQTYLQAMGLSELPLGGTTLSEYYKNITPTPTLDTPMATTAPVSEPEVPGAKKEKTPKNSFLLSDQAWMDTNIDTAAFMLGQSLSFDSGQMYDNPDARSRGKAGNWMRGIGAAGKIGLNLGRVVGAGMGWQNRYQQTMQDYWRRQREGLAGEHLYEYAEDGGRLRGGLPVLEDGEYFQLPTGEVSEVEGRTHEQGGEQIGLPEGTKVVSDNLKVGSKQAKDLRTEFGINTKAKDTYATVIDKYKKKIKLSNLEDELRDIEIRLGAQKDTKSDATKRMNILYLQKKALSLQEEIESKNKDLEDFTNHIFNLQESKKRRVDTNTIQAISDQYGRNAEEVRNELGNYEFEDGGRVEVIESNDDLFRVKARAQGMTVSDFAFYVVNHPREFAEETVAQAQYFTRTAPQEYEDGDWVKYGKLPKTRKEDGRENATVKEIIYDFIKLNPSAIAEFERQSYNPETGRYGSYGNDEDLVKFIKNYMPTLASNIIDEKDGVATITKDKNKIKKFQQGYNKMLQDTGAHFIDREFETADKVNPAIDILKFLEDGETARLFDAKAGNFTLTRSPMRRNFVTPEQLEQLNELGVYTRSQVGLYENQDKIKDILGEDAFNELTEDLGDVSVDYVLGTIIPKEGDTLYGGALDEVVVTPDAAIPSESPTGQPIDEDAIRRAMQLSSRPSQARPLFLPDQSTLPPDPLMGHLKVERTYGRMGSQDMTDEETMKEIFRAQDIGIETLQGMPDSQSRAALASIVASSQENINKSKAQLRGQNIQRDMAVEQFNIGQQQREEDARVADILDFEKRQYTALGNTMADYHNYFEFERKRRVGEFNLRNTMANINALSSNYYTDEFGRVRQKPGADLAFAMSKLMQTNALEDKKKKTTTNTKK